MLYHLLYPLKTYFSALNLFRYITFRAAGAAVTSLLISLIIAPIIIKFLKKFHFGEKINNVHEKLYEKHKSKEGIPTMGGIILLISICISVLLWADLSNVYIRIGLITILWLGVIGFIDDYLKCIAKKSKGLSAKTKFLGQILLFIGIGVWFSLYCPDKFYIIFPFFKNIVVYIGVFYFVVLFFVIVGTSNAVNLTDGLDGLAIGCVIIAAAAYAVLSYISGNTIFSSYLSIPFINGAGELSIFCTAIIGAGLGFLWFNSYPAQVFMGDTGSLALGGIIGIIAVMIKQELLLIIVGGVFVIEALSVIIQVVYFKKTGGKRFFLISPLHHHFEMKGLQEPKIVVRFWILAIIFAVISLCTLKIR
jgi:phospho-N-acetylmuramoyl-pentapeptide-transferase